MKRFSVTILVAITVYFGTYTWLRASHVDQWNRDGHYYVIFPKSTFVYYVYRPLTYLDAHLTGMRFHIGPHRE
jgi:hypothetical protein